MMLPRQHHAVRTLLTVLATLLIGLVAGFTGLPSAQAATGDGSPSDSNLRFVGRWDRTDSAAYVPGFAGAYVRTGFTGTTVKLKQRNAIDLYYSIDGGADRYLQNVKGTADLTPTKLLEFIGDSITVGTTSSKNALTAYGWLTGEQLGAAHTQIAEGGACLVSAADGCTGMADRFLRLNTSATAGYWDFSRYQASSPSGPSIPTPPSSPCRPSPSGT